MGFLHVSAELITHRREQLVLEVRFAARAETCVQRGRQDRSGDRLVDRRHDRPASLAGVGHAAGELRQRRILQQRDRREVEQPGGDDAAAAPHFSHVPEVDVVLVMRGVAKRRRLRVDSMRLLADVGGTQDSHALRVGRHEAVLNPVVHHLDEVPGAVRPAVKVALLGGTAGSFATWGARDVADARCERHEQRIEVLDDRRFTADHHAVAALEPPDASARAYVHVVDAPGRQLPGAPDVVDVIRIATVDHDVVFLEQRHQILDGRVDDCRRDHQPDDARLTELLHQLGERRRSLSAGRCELLHRAGIAVVHDAGVVIAQETAHHIRAHPAETDHSELHDETPC